MNFSSKNSGMGCHFLLQGIFPTSLLYCRQILYRLSDQGSPVPGYLGTSPEVINLTYADDSTTVAESKLKSLLMKVKVESENAGLKHSKI